MEKTTVIIDNGSGFCRAGFSNECQPKSVIRTVIEVPDFKVKMQGTQSYDNKNSADHYSFLDIRPINHGIITEWRLIELLWDHIFKCELNVFSENQVVFMNDSPSSPTTNREMMAEILFESFHVLGLQVSNTAFHSLCSAGNVTGLVIDSGFDVSHTTAIIEGKTIRDGTFRLDIAGNNLTNYLSCLLKEANRIPPGFNHEQLIHLKEKYCYVSLDFDQDMAMQHQPYTIKLPDGSKIALGKEKFQCFEPLFNPQILQIDFPGLHKMTLQTIEKVPPQYTNEVIQNIVLAGGSSKCERFPVRIREEIFRLCPLNYGPKFIAHPARSTAAWNGAAIIASLNISKNIVITKDEYNEHGAAYVHQKFF
ncbi:uncharacterized protein LOC142140513 [Mixophyes fleayi]|uniref:uncharacterized protein LOC142140513 n=1 Tax=Mixophyes fleayi TaxID=3061075 RepID=UPI003F4DE539